MLERERERERHSHTSLVPNTSPLAILLVAIMLEVVMVQVAAGQWFKPPFFFYNSIGGGRVSISQTPCKQTVFNHLIIKRNQRNSSN